MLVAAVANAQQSGEAERKAAPGNSSEKASPAEVVRRLESVTWEPLQGQLTWVVSVWDLHSDMSHPAELERYAIHVKLGTMESKGESRRFEVPEDDLHALMDIISVYAMRSTIWWEQTGDADRQAPPGIVPDGAKDKPKGDGQQEKPKSAPAGKAMAPAQPNLHAADGPVRLRY
jgi:hypothetical protein